MTRRHHALGALVAAALVSLALPPPDALAQGRRPGRPGRRPRRPRRPRQPAPPPEPAAPVAPPQGSDERPPESLSAAPLPPPVEAPPAEPAANARRPVAIDASLGVHLFQRHLFYRDDAMAQWRRYDLDIAPAIAVGAEWFPGAHFTAGALAHIAVTGGFEYALGIRSADRNGNVFGTTAFAYSIGARGRIPIGLTDIGIGLSFGGQVFAIDQNTPAGDPGVPAVDYKFLRPALSARIGLHERFSILVNASYLFVLGWGEFRSRYFTRVSTGGFDAGLGVSVGIVAGLEVRAGVDVRWYFHSMNAEPDDLYQVGGADDQYFGATIALAYRR